jgi:hypothetical protein
MHAETVGELARAIVTFRVNICLRSLDVRHFEQRHKNVITEKKKWIVNRLRF